jgi:type VI secretion system ImpM family protein
MRSLLSKLKNLRGGAFSGDVVLRAFGKLPISREFIHVEDGEGPARAFAEWLGSGHDAWVASHSDSTRGELQPARLAVAMPSHESTWIVATVWPSHDAAPRHFPFTLFVTVPVSGAPADPTARVLQCVPVWERLDEIWLRLPTRRRSAGPTGWRRSAGSTDLWRRRAGCGGSSCWPTAGGPTAPTGARWRRAVR